MHRLTRSCKRHSLDSLHFSFCFLLGIADSSPPLRYNTRFTCLGTPFTIRFLFDSGHDYKYILLTSIGGVWARTLIGLTSPGCVHCQTVIIDVSQRTFNSIICPCIRLRPPILTASHMFLCPKWKEELISILSIYGGKDQGATLVSRGGEDVTPRCPS